MSKQYYFVSDLHIGGDGDLQQCEFEDEFIDFLKMLEAKEDTELLIVGDSFGLWEFTELEGIEKLEELIRYHERLFNQFKVTGENVKITIIPGNHDYELACYPEYIERLKDFNVILEPVVSTTRDIAGKKVWIEHGMQDDEHNAMPDFGNPYANPIGYFITRHVVGTAGKQSSKGKYNWLKDIQSVSPMEEVPHWMFSNYFYREMSMLIRLLLVPFLAMFTISVIALAGTWLESKGILGTSIFTDNNIFQSLGFIGGLLDAIIWINGIVIVFLIPIAIILWLILRDAKSTLERFQIVPTKEVLADKESEHVEKAEKIFEKHPEVAVYLFGHTHHAYIKKLENKAIVNTGTWLKQLSRITSRFMLLPDVYYPHYCLNYFVIKEADGEMEIEYHTIDKVAPAELSWLQRLVILGKRKQVIKHIPMRTILS